MKENLAYKLGKEMIINQLQLSDFLPYGCCIILMNLEEYERGIISKDEMYEVIVNMQNKACKRTVDELFKIIEENYNG